MTAHAAQAPVVHEIIPSNDDNASVSVKIVSLETYTEHEILVINGRLVDPKHLPSCI